MARKSGSPLDGSVTETPASPRVRFGDVPDDLSAFGAEETSDYYVQGWVATEDVVGLLAAIGVPDREHIEFPSHYIASRHGERWSVRIEPAATHQVHGKLINAHHWVYKREQPERMAGQS